MGNTTYFLLTGIIVILIIILGMKLYLTYCRNKRNYNMHKDNIKQDMINLKYVVQDSEEE